MEWDVKFVLAKLLNDMKYKEAVELINAHNDNVDAQDVDIFISGFSLVYAELLNPISPILERYLSSLGTHRERNAHFESISCCI